MSEKIRQRNIKNSQHSPWRKKPMAMTENAHKVFYKNQKKDEEDAVTRTDFGSDTRTD